ncbi:complexin-3-like, partial [Clarias magur]
MNVIVKKSLASCVSRVNDGIGKKGKAVRRSSAPCCYSHITYDSSWIRAYQAELHRERKLRQGILAQKKAQRTVLKSHYRNPRHYTK